MFNQHYCKILVLAACVFAASQSVACSRPVAPSASSSAAAKDGDERSVEEDILFYVNKFRRSKGLKPLELSNVVSIEARDHSKSMATGRRGFGHDGFESRVGDISKKLGTVRAAAENVAYGNLSAQAVVDGWIKSPGHRKNMLGDFNLIGIGTAKGKGNIVYFTQIFINKPATTAKK
ncbi:CAP domain-containing protein [Chitinophaga sp. GCM10012297]|uniref:CAP domain-containing protein n=1 Tax=Chitinophaga chungangae TaxID=2821488 RepID=A0ABS3YGY3_9BACT|nr:CAP domain-containing protein [Chitinophaga chungangae]MBO9153904.1 CAP domain-containing protein [Chitinophaga chungangae]